MTATGSLNLAVGLDSLGRSIAVEQFHQGSLRIMQPFHLPDGSVAYTVINPGGGYLDGDTYEVSVNVGPGASLTLDTQAATKVYRTPRAQAAQTMHVRLASGASFTSIPGPVILYRDAAYTQKTVVEMAPDASLLMAEIVTPGWSPDQAHFSWTRLQMRTEVRVPDGRLLVDHLFIEPSSSLTGVGMMENYTHVGTVLAVSPMLDDDTLSAIRHVAGGASRIQLRPEYPVAVCARTLGISTEKVAAVHEKIIRMLQK